MKEILYCHSIIYSHVLAKAGPENMYLRKFYINIYTVKDIKYSKSTSVLLIYILNIIMKLWYIFLYTLY